MKTIESNGHIYQVRDEFPVGYVIWNIGRDNFPLVGYLPLCRYKDKANFYIDPDSLVALNVRSETLCSIFMDMANYMEVDWKVFDTFMKDFVQDKI